MPGSPRRPGTVTVIVTVLRDIRVERTLRSLLRQTRPPDRILVDDGGGAGPVREIARRMASESPRIVYLDAPGSIPESRNRALREVETEFVAFLDADEVAPPEWLDRLLAPFADPAVGFTGGPTPAMEGTARTIGARYYDAYLRRFYETIARYHPHALPMGNSAWRTEVFDRVGLLDTTLYEAAASEDQEMALRALRAGYLGRYVAEAGVAHDFSDLTLYRWLAKQSRYALGGYVVWRRHGSTYEASAGGLLPYIAPPALIALGTSLPRDAVPAGRVPPTLGDTLGGGARLPPVREAGLRSHSPSPGPPGGLSLRPTRELPTGRNAPRCPGPSALRFRRWKTLNPRGSRRGDDQPIHGGPGPGQGGRTGFVGLRDLGRRRRSNRPH